MTAADTQILLNKLQSNINQLELTNKGALNALEFRLDAILQANLDTFWLLICAILVFLMQAGFMCLETGLSRNKNSINVALKNVSDFGISVVVFWAFGFALMYGTSVSGLFGTKFFFFTTKVAGYQTYFVFQAMFVATAATIISGAVAERLKFFSYIIITLLVAIVYLSDRLKRYLLKDIYDFAISYRDVIMGMYYIYIAYDIYVNNCLPTLNCDVKST